MFENFIRITPFRVGEIILMKFGQALDKRFVNSWQIK